MIGSKLYKFYSIFIFLFGIVICLGAAFPRTLLTNETWVIEGEISTPNLPSSRMISKDIVGHLGTTYVSSSHYPKYIKGSAVSQFFETPHFLSLAFREGWSQKHEGLRLECESGEIIFLIRDHTNANWSENTWWINRKKCGDRARLRLVSQEGYVTSVSTPFKANVFHYLKHSIFAAGFYFQIAFTIFILFFLTCYALNRAALFPRWHMHWLSFVIMGLLAYILFFLYWYKKDLAVGVNILLLLYGALWVWRNKEFSTFLRQNRRWLSYLYGFGLFITLLLWLPHLGNLTWLPSTRFYPADWSSDHIAPLSTIKALIDKSDISQALGGQWLVSDRPPLFTGLLLIAAPFWMLTTRIGLGDEFVPLFFSLATIFNLLWIYPLWFWRRRFGLNLVQLHWVLVALFSTGFIVFNASYSWPKLITVLFAFPSYLLVQDFMRKKKVHPQFLVATIIAGILAVLCHGGVFYYYLTVSLILISRPKWIVGHVKPICIAFALVLLIYLPWSLWVKWVLPTHGALIKVAFTGDFGWETKLSPLQFIFEHFGSLTFMEWLKVKWAGIVYFSGYLLAKAFFEEPLSVNAFIRKLQQLAVLPALAPFLFVVFFQFKQSRVRHVRYLLGLGILAHLCNLLLAWKNNQVIIMNSYPSFFALLLFLIILTVQNFHHRIVLLIISLSSIPWVLDSLSLTSHLAILSQAHLISYMAISLWVMLWDNRSPVR